jgi:hypothetical protein
MEQPVRLLGTPNIPFVSLLIIGGLAAWIAGPLIGGRHGILANILVGIAGSSGRRRFLRPGDTVRVSPFDLRTTET